MTLFWIPRAVLAAFWFAPIIARLDGTLNPSALRTKTALAEIYGSDISLFAAHLATLNLASRDINEEENYPRIARRNFFEIRADKGILATATRFARRENH